MTNLEVGTLQITTQGPSIGWRNEADFPLINDPIDLGSNTAILDYLRPEPVCMSGFPDRPTRPDGSYDPEWSKRRARVIARGPGAGGGPGGSDQDPGDGPDRLSEIITLSIGTGLVLAVGKVAYDAQMNETIMEPTKQVISFITTCCGGCCPTAFILFGTWFLSSLYRRHNS